MLKAVVLDSNIWLRYFLKGQLAKLAQLILENDLIVYSSEHLIAELEDVLSRPKFVNLPTREFLDFHRAIAEVTLVNYEFRGSPDPKDDFLFDLALSAEASHLVTEDKPLLNLIFVRSVKIISHQQFLDILAEN